MANPNNLTDNGYPDLGGSATGNERFYVYSPGLSNPDRRALIDDALKGITDTTRLDNLADALLTDRVATTHLKDDAVTSAKLAAGAVDTTALGADAVTNAKIADEAIEAAQITTTASEQAGIRKKIAVPVYVADRTALKGLDTTKDLYAYLGEAGREGVLKWQSASQAATLVGDALTTTAVNSSTGALTIAGHGLHNLAAVIVTSAVNGLSDNTIYWANVVDDDTIKLASSITNAFAGTSVTLTGTTNFSLKQHFDPMEGYFICPTSDLTGASGAWVRPFNQPCSIRLFGATNSGFSSASIQGAYHLAGRIGLAVYFPGGVNGSAGGYNSNTNIYVPVGAGSSNSPNVDTYGDGWNTSRLTLIGASIDKGLYFLGPDSGSPSYCGSVRDLKISCISATRCITAENLNHPRFERVSLTGAAGAGLFIKNSYMGRLDQALIGTCGSATESPLMIDGCTTFMWNHSRISGANSGTLAAIMIDDTIGAEFIGGNAESAGIGMKISSIADRTGGCQNVNVRGMSIENPGNGNPYIEIGSGWNGGASGALTDSTFDVIGTLSGTTSMPCAVQMEDCANVRFVKHYFVLPTGTNEAFQLKGTGNKGIFIAANVNRYGSSWPWVTVNGSMRNDAGAKMDWLSDGLGAPFVTLHTISGTGPSVLANTSQGGWYRWLVVTNASATSLATLTGGVEGMEIILQASNGNTTITHGTSANGLSCSAGSDLAMVSGKPYKFVFNGTYWVQVV